MNEGLLGREGSVVRGGCSRQSEQIRSEEKHKKPWSEGMARVQYVCSVH